MGARELLSEHSLTIHLHFCIAVAVANSASSSYKSMSEAVRPVPPTTAGDTCANDRVNPIATIQEGVSELVGDEAPTIPNGVTDSTVTLKDQVSELSALHEGYSKVYMSTLPTLPHIFSLHCRMPSANVTRSSWFVA